MTMGSLRAGASRFAHLAGLGRASRRADEDNEDRHDEGAKKKGRRADEEDDDQRCDDAPESGDTGDEDNSGGLKKGSRADDDQDGDDDDDKPAGKKSKRSRRADDGDGDEDDDDTPAAKRSRRADEGDEDDDEDDDDKREMSGRGPAASARRRERARCAAIFAHPAAGSNPELAASLAFETTMTRREALAVLKSQSSRPADRSYRSSRNANLGSEPKQTREANIQSSWDAAFKKVGKRG